MSRIAKDQEAKWQQIESRNYAGQCKYMLNGFWDTLQKDAELVWNWCQSFTELDQDKHGDGNELDEFWSHKFLEGLGETMTVIEMREKFRKIDADFNKHMSMVEYIMFRYGFSIPSVLTCPQGDNTAGIKKAQAMVDEAQKALDEMNAKLASAKEAADHAKEAAEAAKKAAKAVADAEAEAKAALAELQAEEKAFEDKKAALEKTKNDMSIGVVKRNKAANELDQLMSEDPLPLRKAKINQEATVRKMEKAAKPFNEASAKAKAAAEAAETAAAEATAAANHARAEREKAEAAKNEADAKAAAAEEAKAQSEAAVKEAESMLQAAVNTLEETKKKGGVAHGAIWWMERSIEEKKKYMPGYKGPKK